MMQLGLGDIETLMGAALSDPIAKRSRTLTLRVRS